MRRARDVKLLLRCRVRGLRRFYLCFGRVVPGFGIVELLLGDKAWPGGGSLLQTISSGVQSGMVGFSARHFVLRPHDLILAVTHAGVCAFHLSIKLRDFEHSKHLTGADVVADIHIDPANVSGDLRVEFDFLIGHKLTSNGQRAGDSSTANESDSGSWQIGGGSGRTSLDACHNEKDDYCEYS